MRAQVTWLIVVAALVGLSEGSEAQDAVTAVSMAEARPLAPRVVNGVLTSYYPSVVAILSASNRLEICTGTWVGCDTVLTAAHCVCSGSGPSCQPGGAGLVNPAALEVFAQHAGSFPVTSVSVPSTYQFGILGDVAILRLGSPVEGVAPSGINLTQRPSPGGQGVIVGFGLSAGGAGDYGLKQVGQVTTATCTAVPDSAHVCWAFSEPLGPPGMDSNTCNGDSGGPLFVDFGGGDVVAGVTSGGMSNDCLAPDASFDSDVYQNRAWILSQGGSDLGNTTCGTLPQAGGAGTLIHEGSGELDEIGTESLFSFPIASGADLLRVGLNGDDSSLSGTNDFDLFVRQGSPPSASEYDCSSRQSGPYEFCEVDNPQAGTWYALAQRVTGSGAFQVTATEFHPGSSSSPCTPSATVLCIDDEPGDRRFEARVIYDTAMNGGSSGSGQAIPLESLGLDTGGLFWFFSPDNPEMLIKVLDGCGINDHYWVFYSAGTNVGLVTTVRDTLTGDTWQRTNPDGRAAPPEQDILAFECD